MQEPSCPSVNWKTPKNIIKLFALLVEFVFVLALPLKVHPSPYGTYLNPLFFQSAASQSGSASFAISITLIIALFSLYTALFLKDLWKYGKHGFDSSLLFFSLSGAFIYGHKEMLVPKPFQILISLLSNSLLMPVSSSLLSVLSCQYDGVTLGVLASDPLLHCWQPSHSIRAFIATVLFSYYFPLCVTIGPILSESNSSELDIKFNSTFCMIVNLFKSCLFVVPVFFQDRNATIITILTGYGAMCVTSQAWNYATFFQGPSSVRLLNVWQNLPFITGFVLALALLIGLKTFWLIVTPSFCLVLLSLVFWTCYLPSSGRLEELIAFEN